ncbi:oligosaccharide flippase family protein [Nocardioides cynanchi]|uniref:oligosaccharide flippase family protein n=1 Tax=Nocardioides cynanchi TaxID=2558918 RepID=UPI00177C0511|nr:oligosaccharide flippase family protein [Nocardioides cynanchi]
MSDSKAESGDSDAERLNRRNVRGSSLLLVGRLLSLFFTVLTQVVIVRALSKSDFGAFAYAFTLTAALRILLSLGQGRLLSRFLAKYEEEKDYARMWGAILMAFGAIAVTSVVLLGAMAAGLAPLIGGNFDNPDLTGVLLILMFLAPLNALDQVFISVFAVFSRPTAIFIRKYVLTPALQLSVVIFIAMTNGSVEELALGYVLSSAFGIGIYVWLFFGVMRDRGAPLPRKADGIVFPFREVFSFSVPTMTQELAYLVTNTGSVIILGHYRGGVAVANFRSVLPAARLNQIVYQTFVTMFLPMTARLHTRGDHDGVRETYWHSSHFQAVTTFPIMVMTTVFAHVTTVTLFGQRYADASTVLLALSIGYYVSIALGFNIYVLQVYGKLKFLVYSNIGVSALSIGLAFALSPKYGAAGAAVGAGATMAIQNVVNEIVLIRVIGWGDQARRWIRPYLVVAAGLAVLVVVKVVLDPGFVVALLVSAVVSLGVLRQTRRELHLLSLFPELKRFSALGPLLA